MSNRRERPNLRYTCKFYSYSATANAEPTVNDYGELEQEFSLVAEGYFAKEKPIKPREIREGDRGVNQQEDILIGAFSHNLLNIKQDMFCYIPQLNKVYAVNGNAFDPYGDMKRIHIYVVDNVTQDVRQKILGVPLNG